MSVKSIALVVVIGAIVGKGYFKVPDRGSVNPTPLGGRE